MRHRHSTWAVGTQCKPVRVHARVAHAVSGFIYRLVKRGISLYKYKFCIKIERLSEIKIKPDEDLYVATPKPRSKYIV